MKVKIKLEVVDNQVLISIKRDTYNFIPVSAFAPLRGIHDAKKVLPLKKAEEYVLEQIGLYFETCKELKERKGARK